MESKPLPTKLGKEPLIDAVFELRFSTSAPAVNIIPGALYSQLSGIGQVVTIEKLPISQIPETIRQADPNLKFLPVVKLDWQNYFILIGDSSICVSCKLPYPGWKLFRTAIAYIVGEVAKIGIVNAIERYSLKYVDIVPITEITRQIDGLNWDVRVGGHVLRAEVANIRVEIPRGNYLHLVSIQTAGVAEISGRPRVEGVVVDVDSICKVAELPLAQFIKDISDRLDGIHAENKAMFFECLTPATLEELEPSYE